MMEDSQRLFTFLLLIFLQVSDLVGEVNSRTRLEVKQPQIINLRHGSFAPDLLSRRRREAQPPGLGNKHSDPGPEFSNITQLADKNHNEAIVHWSGQNSNAIFVLTREHKQEYSIPSSTLYRSTDYGATFENMNKEVFSSGTIIQYFYVSPANISKLVFCDVQNHTIYTTDDEGLTVKAHLVSFRPDFIIFHPTKDNMLLAYTYGNMSLFVSTDLAETWTTVHDHVSQRFFWGNSDYESDSLIHMELINPLTGDHYYKSCSPPYCTDSTFDRSIGTIDPYSLQVENEYVYVQKSLMVSSTLLVSYKRKPFKEAYFPRTLHPLDFYIIDSDEHQIFVAVNHQEQVVNLYLSDTTGQFFTQTLDHVVNIPTHSKPMVDLYEVKGLQGVYMANRYVTKDSSRTYITFDKGGQWSLIPAPELDRNNKSTNCKLPNCSLNLELYGNNFYGNSFALSEENAPGIIIAPGNIGKELNDSSPNMYISRDGGMTWSEMFEGTYTMNILDQGGAMVAVLDDIHISQSGIRYSCDEGQSWQLFDFTSKPIIVDGVLNEPGITTLVVSIFGHELPANTGWTIIKLNFSAILHRQCKKDDYVKWTPPRKIKGHNCLLGQKITYERRKPQAECSNGRDYKRLVKTQLCPCADEDYECDYGYEKNGSVCTAAAWFDPKKPPGECPENSTYKKSQGYRKVASDNCTASNVSAKFQPVTAKCPLVSPSELSFKSLSKVVMKTNYPIKFELIQRKGSKLSTNYSWDFGDGTVKVLTGFLKGHSQYHQYSSGGMYVVKVLAKNIGHSEVNMTVMVEDEILGVHVNVPHGVKIAKNISFNATLLMNSSDNYPRHNPGQEIDHVHYVWHFGDELATQKPLITWKANIEHSYDKPGRYTVIMQAINGVGSAFQKFDIMVYTDVRTVRLSFSVALDNMKKDTLGWRKDFEVLMKNKLMMALSVERNRLEVVMLTGEPTYVDVSMLPAKNSSAPSVQELADKLVAAVKQDKIYVKVGLDTVVVVKHATILQDTDPKTTRPRDLKAVYISVPILLLAAFVSALVVLHYKRKFLQFRRYNLLQNRNAADTLLEEDDDDPPLDPNPDFRLPADDNDDALVGNEPTLVMMTGGERQEIDI